MVRTIRYIFASAALAFGFAALPGCALLPQSDIDQIEAAYDDIRARAEERLAVELDKARMKLEAAKLQAELDLADARARLLEQADQLRLEAQRAIAAEAVRLLVNRASAGDQSGAGPGADRALAMPPGYSAHLVQRYWSRT